MKYLIFLSALFGSWQLNAQAKDIIQEFHSTQIVVVTADSWNSTQGTLSLYELNTQNKWSPVTKEVIVTLGRN
jgi:hypothetical protein